MRRILPRVWSSRSMTSVAAFATFVSFVIETLCVRAQRTSPAHKVQQQQHNSDFSTTQW